MSEAKTRLIIRVRAGTDATADAERSRQPLGVGHLARPQRKVSRHIPRSIFIAGLGFLAVAAALMWTAVRTPLESASRGDGMQEVALAGVVPKSATLGSQGQAPGVTIDRDAHAPRDARAPVEAPVRPVVDVALTQGELAAAETSGPQGAQADVQIPVPGTAPQPVEPALPTPSEAPSAPAQVQPSTDLPTTPPTPKVAEPIAEEAEGLAREADSSAPLADPIGRAQLTSGIREREPIDSIGPTIVASANEPLTRVFYFTELRGVEGESITHRWEHEGQVVAEVHFPVGGARWRVYSSKNLPRNRAGAWRVVVINAVGERLAGESFTFAVE